MRRMLAGKAVEPIGLGCMSLSWSYGRPAPRDEAIVLLNRALDLGYDHFDTANIYGMGGNETLIGEALSGRRDEFFLASKTGIVVDGQTRGVDCAPASISNSIDGSLKRLKTDHIDLLYMHRFDPKVPIADSVGALVRAMEAGKIGAYGVSEWNAQHIREAHAIHPVAAVQTEYSLWTRNPELGVLDTTRELGIALVAFSPVGRGALCGTLRDPDTLDPGDLRRTMPRFTDEHWPANRAMLDRFENLAREAGVAPAQLALSWVLARGDYVHVIPGTANMAHLEENRATKEVRISEDVLRRADAVVNHATVSGHRYPGSIIRTIDTEDFVA